MPEPGLGAADWRFLLAEPAVRRLGVLGPVGSGPDALADGGVEVVTLAGGAGASDALDAVLAAPDLLAVASLRARQPRVPIVVELGPGAAVDPRWWRLAGQGTVALAVPRHQRRQAIVRLDHPGPLAWRFGASASRLRRPLARAAPWRIVVLGPPERRRDGILAWLGAELPDLGLDLGTAATLLLTPGFRTSAHVVGLVGRARPEVVVKVPRADDGTVAAEAAGLRRLWQATSGRDVGAPRLLAEAAWGRRQVLVESAVAGRPLGAREAARDRAGTASLLASWVAALPAGPPEPAGPRLHRLVRGPLAAVAALGSAERELVDRTLAALEALEAVGLPRVFEHGDVSAPNLLHGERGLAVVDWELAEPDGLPAHDLFVALGFVARAGQRAPAVALVDALVEDPPDWAVAVVRRYRDEVALPLGVLDALLLACAARVSAALVTRARLEVAPAALAWWRAQPFPILWRSVLDRLPAGPWSAVG